MERKQVTPIDYFEKQTTQKNDYRWPKDVKRTIALWSKEKEETPLKKLLPLSCMDVETLVPYVPGIQIPFNLHLQKKPILQTNPKDHFELKIKQKSPEDDKIRFTRPRVYKAPEISLDDIPDKKTRDMIIDYTYSSTWSTDSRDAVGNIMHRKIPTSTWQSPLDDNVCFKEETFDSPSVKKWSRKCGKHWDKLQTCYTVDPSKMFWHEKHKEKPLVNEFVLPNEFFDHILKLKNEEKLRMAYKVPTPGYTGFIPKAPFNIKPEKSNFRPTDAQLTLNEAVERSDFVTEERARGGVAIVVVPVNLPSWFKCMRN